MAVDADGGRSETVAAQAGVITPVDAPASVSATADGPYVLVEWAEVTGAERYEVTRNGELLADDVTGIFWTDTEVPLGDHTYQVTAVDEDGEGEHGDRDGGDLRRRAVAGGLPLTYCEYADGIHVDVIGFRDSAQRNTRVAEIAGLADPAVGTWAYGSGPAEGDLYLSVPGTNPPWRFLTFYGGGSELFAVYAEWDGHTQEELRDTWFVGAPF